MKRFKLIFHICFVVIALGVLYFSIDVLMNTEAYLSKIKLSSYIKFPRYVMTVFLIIALMMITEFILERFNVYQVKDGMKELEEEIIRLKAKLFDKSEEDGEEAEDMTEEPDEEEEDEA
ncbi:MAG: hypothetical protein RIM99_01165 [Cyclobacteriaceae bacterium]